jgi:hypothetical protein
MKLLQNLKKSCYPFKRFLAKEDSGNFQQVASSNFLLGQSKYFLLPTINSHQIRLNPLV